ncbi:hypothetical protein KPL33_12285 [Clostridium algidicarnis]|nr:hypothetical protein [Clostridium algidicarnis]
MKRFIYGLLALSLLMISGCSINEDSSSNDSSPLPQVGAGEDNSSSIVETKSKAEKLLHSMTLEEKIGQLFIIRPDDLELNLTSEQINDSTNDGAVELDTNMQETLKKYPIGGVALFGKNILNPTQLTTFISDMQKQSTIPLFVSIDEEGGIV